MKGCCFQSIDRGGQVEQSCAMRFAQNAESADNAEAASQRLAAAQCFVHDDAIGPELLRKCNGVTFSGAESDGPAKVRERRAYFKPDWRTRHPCSDRYGSIGAQEFVLHGGRNDDLPVQEFKNLDLLDENEVVEGAGVRDDNHLC